MIQVEDEYELTRGNTVYQLTIEYEWAYYPPDDEGCPVMPQGAPAVEITSAEVLATWRNDLHGDDQFHENAPASIERGGREVHYPPLDPPMTEQEIRDFDEHLADRAACAREDWEDRGYRR